MSVESKSFEQVFPFFDPVWDELEEMELGDWAKELKQVVSEVYSGQAGHGDWSKWHPAFEKICGYSVQNRWSVEKGRVTLPTEVPPEELEPALKKFHPWRKGPFQFGEVFVDTEWRSDWKWQRLLEGGLPELKSRRVLDVGCGNGYHLWRMREAGAGFVMGIDPSLLFGYQFLVTKYFGGLDEPLGLLPIGIEGLPEALEVFDVTFSMGVLYHRRSPIEHLDALRGSLVRGGELVLETLVVDGDENTVLVPEGRYAQMRNVWFLPSVPLLMRMLRRAGFDQVELIDCSDTSVEEQRATDWMRFQSLPDFLDPNDPTKTIEGYPAPRRAALRARKCRER